MQKYKKKEEHGKEEHEIKIKGYVCLILGIVIILFIITAIVLGYFISYSGAGGERRDGFGRLLDEIPDALNLVLPQWAGHIWLIIDCLIFLGLIMLIDKLFTKAKLYFKGLKNVDF